MPVITPNNLELKMDLQEHEEAIHAMLNHPASGEQVFSTLSAVQDALVQHCVGGGMGASEQVNDFADEALAKVIFAFAPPSSLVHIRALMDSEEFEEKLEEEFEGEE